MASNDNRLFAQPNGHPILFFVEPNEIPQSTRKNLARTIELYGGAICMNASQAHIILVVRGTAEAEKYANLWAAPPERRPVLDYVWVKSCLSKGCLLMADRNWAGLLVPHDEAEAMEVVLQLQATPNAGTSEMSDGFLGSSVISTNESTGGTNGETSTATPSNKASSTFTVNGSGPSLSASSFQSMTSGFPSQNALNTSSSMPTFPNFMQFPAHLAQNSIPIAFIQPQMLAQLPFLYNPSLGMATTHPTAPESTSATPSSTIVPNDRQTSVTDVESSPSSRSIPTRREFAASRKLLLSKSPRPPSTTAFSSVPNKPPARSLSSTALSSSAHKFSASKQVTAPVSIPPRDRPKHPAPRERSQSPPSERRRGLRSAASEPSKFFITHDGDALRFYIPMDVENHMEILENIRTHGGRGTPIGYCDYVIMDSPATVKLLPHIHQLGIRGVKPGWVEACIDANELLPVDDYEVEDEEDLLHDEALLESRSISVVTRPAERSHKKKRMENGQQPNSPFKPKILDSLTNLSPEQLDALPSAPRVLVPHAGGYRFTHEDSQFLINYANVRFSQEPQLPITTILKEVANNTRSSHSYDSWRRYYKDQTEVWKLYISFSNPKAAYLDADDEDREHSHLPHDNVSSPSRTLAPHQVSPSAPRPAFQASDRPLPETRPMTPPGHVDLGDRQKYTAEDIEYFFDFVAWTYMNDPDATRMSITQNLTEKLPRHSMGSWSSMWFAQKEALESVIFRAQAYAFDNGLRDNTKEDDGKSFRNASDDEAEAPLDDRQTPPPEPPSKHKYNSNGFCEYPPEDYHYLLEFVRWVAAADGDVSQAGLSQLLAKHAAYHTERGWENYLRKHKTEVARAIRDAEAERGQSSEPEKEKTPNLAMEADAVELEPTRRHALPEVHDFDMLEDVVSTNNVSEQTFEEVVGYAEGLRNLWESGDDAWKPFAEFHPERSAEQWHELVEQRKDAVLSALFERKILREAYLVESELESGI